jgi:hypothetical protein
MLTEYEVLREIAAKDLHVATEIDIATSRW